MNPEHEAFTVRLEADLVSRYGAACVPLTTGAPKRHATLFALRHTPRSLPGIYLVAHRDLLDAGVGMLYVPPGATSPAPPGLAADPRPAADAMALAEPARHFAEPVGRVALAPLSHGGFFEHGIAHGYVWTPPVLTVERPDGVLPWDSGPAFVLGSPAGQVRGAASCARAWARTESDGTVRLHAPPPDGYAGAPVFALLPMTGGRSAVALIGLAGAAGDEVVPVAEVIAAAGALA